MNAPTSDYLDVRFDLKRFQVRRALKLAWRMRWRRVVDWLLHRRADRPLPPAIRMIRDPRVPAEMTYDLNAPVPGKITLPNGKRVEGSLRFRDLLYICERPDGTNALIDQMVNDYLRASTKPVIGSSPRIPS